MRNERRETGFTYLAVLFFVAIMGVMLAAAGVAWSTAQQRDKERELLFIGNQFRKAIAAYYESSPGSIKQYPNTFNDLLKDNRHLATRRHLRRIYADPMTLKPEWGIIRAPDGGIMGIHSLSTGRPMKSRNFLGRDSAFEGAISYADWRFVYEPSRGTVPESGKQPK